MSWPLSCSKPLVIEKRAPGYPACGSPEPPVSQRQNPTSQFSVRLLHKPRVVRDQRELTGDRETQDVQWAAGHVDPSTTKRYDRRGHNPEKSVSFFANSSGMSAGAKFLTLAHSQADFD